MTATIYAAKMPHNTSERLLTSRQPSRKKFLKQCAGLAFEIFLTNSSIEFSERGPNHVILAAQREFSIAQRWRPAPASLNESPYPACRFKQLWLETPVYAGVCYSGNYETLENNLDPDRSLPSGA